MTNASQARSRFRAVLQNDACVFAGSVQDPISARIAESAGYEIGVVAGSVASMTVLAAPDIILLTLTEFAEHCRRITRASALPLLVDADHGYGNALNAMRTVQELEAAGIAALTLEDTDLPPVFGAAGKGRLISQEEAAGKLRAAIAARQDPALVIVGRSNLSLTTLDDVVARARAYEAQGVDAFFIVGVKTRAELDAISGAIRLPILLGNAPNDVADPAYLASRRVRVALQGHMPIRAAIKAMHDVLEAQRRGETPPESVLASPALMKQVLRDEDYDRWAKDFM